MAAKYRKISPCIWNDAKVRELSDKGKLALLFLLTHPHMTPLGVIRANCPGLGCELGWKTGAFKRAFAEILSAGIAHQDERATLIWFPNFLKYNLPESPNVVTSWVGAFGDLPECALRDAALRGAEMVVAGLSEPFQKAFREGFLEASGEAFVKSMPNQEQEQDKKREGCERGRVREVDPPVDSRSTSSALGEEQKTRKKTDCPSKGHPQWPAFLSCWQIYPVQQGQEEAWREWMRLYENRTLAESYVIRDALLLLVAEDSRWQRGKVPKMTRWLAGKGWDDKPFVEPAAYVQGASQHVRPMTARQVEVAERGEWSEQILAMEEAINGNKSANRSTGTQQGICTLPPTQTRQGGIRAAGQGMG